MFSTLSLASQRLRLAERLRARNVYVRLHAYEYLLGYAGGLRGVLLLEPSRGRAFLFLSGRSKESESLVEIVREELFALDPKMELKTVWTASG